MTNATAQEVPLIEQLRQVPALSRLVIDDGEYSTTYIPVGVLMHKAADLIDAQAAEIERMTSSGVGYSQQTVDALSSERDRLRAALTAAMEVVQRERTRIAYNAKGAPPAVEIGYADIMRRLDAVIAQADAALGSEG